MDMDFKFGDKVYFIDGEKTFEGIYVRREGRFSEILVANNGNPVSCAIETNELKIKELKTETAAHSKESTYGIVYKHALDPGVFKEGTPIAFTLQGSDTIIGTVIETQFDQAMVSYYDAKKKGINSIFIRWQDLAPVNGKAKIVIEPVTFKIGKVE